MRTRWLYTAMLVTVFVCVPVVAGGFERPAAAASLIGIVLARRPVVQVLEGARGAALIPVPGAPGRIQLVSGALPALGIPAPASPIERLRHSLEGPPPSRAPDQR